MAFTSDGARAYVSAEIGGVVSVIDVARDSVIATIAVGDTKPVGVVISPDDKRVYVAEGRGAQVLFIDAATNRVVDSIAVGRRPWGIALSPDGKRLYTADGGTTRSRSSIYPGAR